MKNYKNELFTLNGRLKYIIFIKEKGNVAEFSRKTGLSQQRINRLFIKDKRNNKYPSVPSVLLSRTAELYPDINLYWLLTGKGEVLKGINNADAEKDEIKTDKDYIIELQKEIIATLKEKLNMS